MYSVYRFKNQNIVLIFFKLIRAAWNWKRTATYFNIYFHFFYFIIKLPLSEQLILIQLERIVPLLFYPNHQRYYTIQWFNKWWLLKLLLRPVIVLPTVILDLVLWGKLKIRLKVRISSPHLHSARTVELFVAYSIEIKSFLLIALIDFLLFYMTSGHEAYIFNTSRNGHSNASNLSPLMSPLQEAAVNGSAFIHSSTII